MKLEKITPCLWFADQAEDAARFYTSIFPNSEIGSISRYSDVGNDIHGRPAGSVMTVEFSLDGQMFTALNGGPVFEFSPAISFQVMCDTQEELDHYWEKLGEDGDEAAQQCGWLADRFGLSWQIIPKGMNEMLSDPTSEGARRAMRTMLQMKKLDLGELQRAYAGQS